MPTSELAELLDRASRGDRQAFAEFYDQTAGAALRLARLRVVDPRDAEEVVVRAYALAWNHDNYRRSGHSPRVWLLDLVEASAQAG